MTKKGQRNQVQQPSKTDKAHGGYLPSVERDGHEHSSAIAMAQRDSTQRSEKNLQTSHQHNLDNADLD